MSLNEQLMRDPLGFAKKYCILGDSKARAEAVDQSKVGAMVFSKMTGLTKISYLNCREVDLATELNSVPELQRLAKERGQMMKNEGAEAVFVTAHDFRADLVPAWYLPWDVRGGMVKLSIPSEAGFQTTWKANDASNYWDRDARKIKNYPRLFLTAAINGCSVFVSGNELEPTVFHGGKDGTIDGDAITLWRNMLGEVDKPKPPKENMFFRAEPKQRLTVGEVNKGDYVKQEGVTDKDGFGTTPTANRFEKALNEAVRKGPIKIRSIRPWGAVFGVCADSGRWTFYLQENASISYDVIVKKNLGFGHKKPKPFCVARPMVVRQIFPSQGGAAVMQNQFRIIPLPTAN